MRLNPPQTHDCHDSVVYFLCFAGECECFPGYEGRACDRSVCPNFCSGHGMCQSISAFYTDHAEELARVGAPPSASYTTGIGSWDASKSFGCKCELGFRGPDCSSQECPSSIDPLGGPSANALTTLAPDGISYRSEFRECSGRGRCDYDSGLCVCFRGFSSDDCSVATALT